MMHPDHEPFRHIRADYWEPATPPSPRHLKLSIPGALALFNAGACSSLAIAAASAGILLLALAGAVVAGALLGIAALDAAAEPPRGWYTRQRGSLFFRRTGAGPQGGPTHG